MIKHCFVTGTDDGVGKTVVARAFLQALTKSGIPAAGFKPVRRHREASRAGAHDKALSMLEEASCIVLTEQALSIACIGEEGEVEHPPLDYVRLSEHFQDLAGEGRHVIVAGSGGWRSVVGGRCTFSEWVIREQLPVILVVGIQQGCINHALLTAEVITADGLPILGWVANRINPCMSHYADIIERLTEQLNSPLLGEIPYLSHPESRDLSQYIDLTKIKRV